MASEATKIPFVEGAAPGTPAANRSVIYVKADGLFYSKDDAGTETLMSAGSAATRASLGLDTSDSPQFAGINVGHASDSTLARVSAGVLSIEGNRLFAVGGADVPIADGGTASSTASDARTALDVEQTIGGRSLSDVGTPASGDLILLQDVSASSALKTAAFSTFGGGSFTPATGRVTLTGGNITTTSTSFVDLTGASITITTGAHGVLLGFAASADGTSGSPLQVRLTFGVDGTDQGGTLGIISQTITADSSDIHDVGFTFLTAALSAGSHTFKVRWRVSTGTGLIFADSSTFAAHFWAMEQGV